MSALRILLADDHDLVRAGFRALLEKIEGVRVVGEARNGREALEKVADLHPDLVLLDINMPGLNGLDTLEFLAKEHASVKVVILSMHANEEYVWRALKAGVRGYLLKGSGPEELRAAIDAIRQGEVYLSPVVSRYVVANFIRETPTPPTAAETLTPRQREILQLIAEGLTIKEIAHKLGLSPKTVEHHRRELMSKLNARNMAHLVHLAIQMGIILTDS